MPSAGVAGYYEFFLKYLQNKTKQNSKNTRPFLRNVIAVKMNDDKQVQKPNERILLLEDIEFNFKCIY